MLPAGTPHACAHSTARTGATGVGSGSGDETAAQLAAHLRVVSDIAGPSVDREEVPINGLMTADEL